MLAYKTRLFSKWAIKEGVSDEVLSFSVKEMEQGLIDAALGASLCKKRVALAGGGKRGGVRTLVAFRKGDRAFFLCGFAKNVRSNISSKEEKALKLLGKTLFDMKPEEIGKAVGAGELIELKE